MSAFENFIQLELPKRPFLNADAPQESILVRRGPGPRQLEPLQLAEGEVVAFLNGELVGISIASIGGINKLSMPITTPATVWSVTHAFNTTDAILQVTDTSGFVIFPDTMQIIDNSNIQITFAAPQAGTLRIIFFN